MESRLNKLERKALKKQARKLFALKNNSDELSLSEKPTKHIIISNGGLICGIERSHLLFWFGRYGNIQSLFMIPGKSFSLVSFKTVEESTSAYSEIHGKPMNFPLQEQKKQITLYLAYLLDTSPILNPAGVSDVRPVLPSQANLHPPGLILVPDFVSEEEEKILSEFFKIGDNFIGDVKNSMKHRRVKHFGYKFIYGKNTVDKEKPLPHGIPTICDSLIEKMIEKEVINFKPNQLTVNQYEAGQGIPPHTDTHSAFTDGIISLSLGSQVVMEFCHPDGRQISLILPERSLLVMTGESRYLWAHGITPRKTDVVLESNGDASSSGLTLKERGFRISLTFRKVLNGPCTCKYPEKCDSQGFESSSQSPKHKSDVVVPNTELEALKLESKHVNDVYDEIADHFSDTRHSPWPKVAKFLKALPAGSLVADVGCGNGKYLAVNKDIVTFGSDRSANLVKICKERGHCAIVCDILSLPYRSNSFNAAISIAVIHHLSTFERRCYAIKELLRIVKPGGLVLIYVWALEQNIPSNNKLETLGSDTTADVKDNVVEHSGTSAVSSREDRGSTSGQIRQFQENSTKNPSEPSYNKDHCTATTAKCEGETEDQTPKQFIIVNETRNVFEQQDLLIPWHFRGKKDKCPADSGPNESLQKEQVFHRYYHVFKEGELESICCQLRNVTVIESYHDKGNWCVILKKLAN